MHSFTQQSPKFMKPLFSLLFAIVFIASCAPTPEPTTDTTAAIEGAKPTHTIPPFYQKVLDAHGGIDQWRAQKSLSFKKGDSHLIDLSNRNEIIKKEGAYTLGFDGNEMWISPNRDSFPGKEPRFYHNLHFYFFALPFVLADPGVNLEEMGIKKVNGKNYNVIKATFGDGVGDAPEDQYILYTDPESHRIELTNYSVTYFDKGNATKYNAMTYTWQEVEGLVVPSSYAGYKWENESLGEKRYEATFETVGFSKEVLPPSTFKAPEGAWIEKK